jgi:NADPH-dependent 2,4-dienoyl-CoA reductase/sulfur reductase-like enzyme
MPREERCRILIVGAGPAGIAAAVAAESAGSVTVLDDNPASGGQIWRGEDNRWTARLQASGTRVLNGTSASATLGNGRILAEQSGDAILFHYEKLILATGARELFLPFPGWTLPGVTGAGGLQALVQGGLPMAGKRVVIAGSGPLLLAAAAHLRQRGAVIEAIAEQAPLRRLASFAAQLWRTPNKIAQALDLQWALRGVPQFTDAWPIAAQGASRVENVVLKTRTGTRSFACDYLACAFGLVPNVELAALAGCELRASFVAVDEWQQTSLQDVLCAGEPTGIGGVDRSVVEGRIAGYVAAGRSEQAKKLFAARRRLQAFSAALANCFTLRDELRHLADATTIVCRCEDVSLKEVTEHASARGARLHARCGMGACQGRICGPALNFVLGWEGPSGHARPPLFPARMGTLAAACDDESAQIH